MALILVVDEDARNREVLASYLARAGHRIATAGSGPEALAVAAEQKPDLVLLDVLIPEIDGFETTRRLKQLAAGEYLPVVLVTALDDVDSRVAGFRAGADEFLPKPVYRAELVTRIGNLLALREERQAVARSHLQLVELQRFKENLTELLVHDLKNPLSVLAANLEFTRHEVKGDGRRDVLEALDDSVAACGRLARMVANLLDISRFEEGRLELTKRPIEVRPLVLSLAREHARAAEERQASIQADADDVVVHADSELLGRVFENVVESAVRLTRRKGAVRISAREADGVVRFRIERDGPTVDPELRGRLFEKYGASEVGSAPRMSRGLGLYFCRLAVEAHGGRILFEDVAVAEGEEPRSAFVVELPAGKR